MKTAAKPIPPLTESDKLRFWSKVDKNGPLPDQSNPHYTGLGQCWIWTGTKDSHGYGVVQIKRKRFFSHRLSWRMANLLEAMTNGVCHRCDNSSCCNPDHLFMGDQLDNVSDMIKKGRRRGCIGETVTVGKLTADKVAAIRFRHSSENVTMKSLAADFGVSVQNVSCIIHRIYWKHI